MAKVSVVVPTYNRFNYLMNTLKSIKEQTYKNIEIIVVNDRSTQQEYYSYNWAENNVNIIHLEENTKKKFGFGCAAYVRNCGINAATGKYIAFCDDDDIWFPQKIQLQLDAIKKTGCKMSATDGLIGNGVYDENKKYKKYNEEHFFNTLQHIYRMKGSKLLENGFPNIWTLEFLKVHNCIICSSVLMEKKLLDRINNMRLMNSGEDYDCWLRALQYTDCVYVKDICFYYDSNHGDGRNY